MTAEHAMQGAKSTATPRRTFRDLRRGRPFWAGVFTMLSGMIIIFPPYASLKFGDIVISLNTIGGMSSLLIGVVLVMCGITMWTRPEFRRAAGIVTLLLALTAIVAANLGVFMIGTLLGLIGAGLAIAWSPLSKPTRRSQPTGESMGTFLSHDDPSANADATVLTAQGGAGRDWPQADPDDGPAPTGPVERVGAAERSAERPRSGGPSAFQSQRSDPRARHGVDPWHADRSTMDSAATGSSVERGRGGAE